jgi:hypothetical protein
MEELTPQFRQAWNRIDARLGQVRNDRLFMNNVAKNVAQGLIRAPGWSGGTIAEIGGGFADAGRFLSEWAKTGKLPEELPDRTAYVISLVTHTCAANAILTYAFTGQMPKGLDYFAFRTGKKDEQGNDERFMFPSYMKDMLAYAKHPGETIINKLHPLISVINDLRKNKDYYGVQIRNPDSSWDKQFGQAGKYVIKSFEPFWTRALRREKERKSSVGGMVAPFFGVMPAPRSVTQSPAEEMAHDLMMEQIPSGARTQEQADRSMEKAKSDKTPYLARTVKRLSAARAVRVYEKMSDKEKQQGVEYNKRMVNLSELVFDKINNSKSLSEEERASLQTRFEAANRK